MAESSIPVAQPFHHIRGRVRLRFPGQLGQREFFASLQEGARGIPGVVDAAANGWSGTLLLTYQGRFEDVARQARAAGLFAVDAETVGMGRPKQPTSRGIAAPDRERTVWFALMAVLGAVQMFRGSLLPPAMTLFWYALRLSEGAPPHDREGDGHG